MIYKLWHGYCLACEDASQFPHDAVPCGAPQAPLVLLIYQRDLSSGGLYAVTELSELSRRGIDVLLPPQRGAGALSDFVHEHGACVLNTAFGNAFSILRSCRPRESYRVTLVGLGDVGGTLLTALKLLGHEIDQIRIFDPYAPLMERYERELNQVLSLHGAPMPQIVPCPEDALFDCDLFLFAASCGVPAIGKESGDVRMAQYAANRDMLRQYARAARQAHYTGLFCQISDPVDHLARAVFLMSNRTESDAYDFAGLLPEQVQGFGLGVMAARAAYYAKRESIDFSDGRVYGPHGQDLIVADSLSAYDEARSVYLTELARTANLQVRELGFKPYIAPGLSSAAISILQLIRGEAHYGAVPIDGAYFGCTSRFTAQGLLLRQEALPAPLLRRMEHAHHALREFDYGV